MTTVCPERDLLPEYLTERLSPADAARVHAHLAGCAVCRRLADELEVGLAAMAMARDEALEQERAAAAVAIARTPETRSGAARARRRPRFLALVAAAACAALIAGTALGVVLERRLSGTDPIAEFPLMSASVLDPASGTASLAIDDGGLLIGLDLAGLPRDADFFECLWHIDGETRSAGTFTALDGVADVELVVAPFEGVPTWTLDIVAHVPDEEPRVVLTAER